MLHPNELWPRPHVCQSGSDWVSCEVRDPVCGRRFESDENQWNLSGYVYPDGSCKPHVLSELTRAAWASVEVDDEAHV